MLRGFLLGVLATIVVAAVCGYIALRNGLVPANADGEPGWLEIWAANTSLDATLDREAPKGPNPVALTDDNLAAGVELYGRHRARRRVGFGSCKGPLPATPAAGDGRRRRRPRGLLLLENKARHPLDGHALVGD